MNILLFIIVYIFALIGYFTIGILIYINLDNTSFNRIYNYFHKALTNLFYKNNKENCYLNNNYLYYNSTYYLESTIWKANYMPFDSIFELLCLLFWPVWLLINFLIMLYINHKQIKNK